MGVTILDASLAGIVGPTETTQISLWPLFGPTMDRRPNILLFVYDTLRPDYLSCYNQDSMMQTPNIDRVANDGSLFENAFSAGPGTDISHAALFTGQFPSQTGLVGGGKKIPENLKLLAEHLSKNGYETFGLSGPGKIRSDLGFERGFNEYVEPYYEDLSPDFSGGYLKSAFRDSIIRRDLIRTVREGPDSLTNLKFDIFERFISNSSEPFFGFANFLTCHAPYNPPRPHKRQATPDLSRGRYYVTDLMKKIMGLEPESIENQNIRTDRVLKASRCLGQPFHADPNWLTDRELGYIRKWYAASVNYLDQRFGHFLEFFNQSGYDDNTIIILCSDHGEHLGEHGLLYHGDFLYDEVIQVPLVMSGPGVPPGKRWSKLVSLVDVFDTICDLADIRTPEDITGRSVLSSEKRGHIFAEYGIRDMSKSKKRPHVSKSDLVPYARGLKCIRTTEHKLVLRSDGATELYELPDEDRLVNDDAEVTENLLSIIEETLGLEFIHFSDELNQIAKPGLRENLERLGYI